MRSFVVITALATLLVATSAPKSPKIASWYGEECRGKSTANGEKFDPDGLTAASWYYPFGTKLKVSANNHFVIVRVNDRGPAKRLHRDIDLSRAAFKQIAPLTQGLVEVSIEECK